MQWMVLKILMSHVRRSWGSSSPPVATGELLELEGEGFEDFDEP
jgi:hypothetical protein